MRELVDQRALVMQLDCSRCTVWRSWVSSRALRLSVAITERDRAGDALPAHRHIRQLQRATGP